MKEGTENKIKFKRLQRRLGLSLWECKGLLESIWNLTAQNTPRGDIGSLSNEDIASAIEWKGDADELITALSEGWLDECSVHRYVVHDWADHCPNYIKGNLAKYGKSVIAGPIEEATREAQEQPARESPKPSEEPPNIKSTLTTVLIRANPSQSMPYRAEPVSDGDGADGDFISVSEDEWPPLRDECNRVLKVVSIGKGGKPRDDCELIVKAVILQAKSEIPESAYAGALDHVKGQAAQRKARNPGALFHTALKVRCHDKGVNLRLLLGRVRIPPWLEPTIEKLSKPPPVSA